MLVSMLRFKTYKSTYGNLPCVKFTLTPFYFKIAQQKTIWKCHHFFKMISETSPVCPLPPAPALWSRLLRRQKDFKSKSKCRKSWGAWDEGSLAYEHTMVSTAGPSQFLPSRPTPPPGTVPQTCRAALHPEPDSRSEVQQEQITINIPCPLRENELVQTGRRSAAGGTAVCDVTARETKLPTTLCEDISGYHSGAHSNGKSANRYCVSVNFVLK
ncbi:uncharacterized protein LOC119810829 [Arvicola amphibius]|uniref:uncharacterized protein LOC119810829 n=1 Tax=Arvicola amphibius TaxID=1047088 RepID=UPI0018E3961C|nr:uncharacterized protein LOC119810829 [Arvicola amphibius]